MITTILATIAVLGLLILVHELGHFIAARAFDIHVSRFSIGLGPKIFGFRRGETDFRISALPLGGYVKLAGMKEMELLEGGKDEGGEAVDPARSFAAKSAGVRAIVLAAGVIMNAVLAVVLLAALGMIWGRPVPAEPVVGNVVAEWLPEGAGALTEIPRGTRITRVGTRPVSDMNDVSRSFLAAHAGELTIGLRDAPDVTITIPPRARERQLLPLAIEPLSDAEPVLGHVEAESPAATAGLRTGDRVAAVDGRPIATWQELSRLVQQSPAQPLELRVRRGDRAFVTTLTPAARYLGERELGRMGAAAAASRGDVPRERLGPVAATGYGLGQSWEIVTLIGSFIDGLFDGRHSPRELGGPVMIAQLSGAASRAGLPTLLFLIALLSINLAVINLLPIPVLDGGYLFLLGVEAIRGRPPSERTRTALGRAGLAMVVGIMVWAVTADVMRLLGV